MSKAKMCLMGILVVASLAGGRLSASGPSGCALPGGEQDVQPSWVHAMACYEMSFCPDDDYCWARCPTASAASCVGSVCQYTLPGGTGPSGGACPEQRFCSDNSHCVYTLYGINGTCVNSVCVC